MSPHSPSPPSRRITRSVALAGLLLACTGATEGPERPEGAPVAGAPRPDIVLVTFDTTRADHVDLDASDGTATPTAAALAASGLHFPRAWAPTPLTLPSHASLFTGLWPVGHGARSNGSTRLVEDVPTLAESLSAAGYATGAVVAALPLVAASGLDQGFDHYDDALTGWVDELGRSHPERTAAEVTEAALALAPRLPAPRFLWVHYFDPHAPYTPPPAQAAAWPDDPYLAEIAAADAALGRLLAGLPEAPADGRMVLLTADHGEDLGDHGEGTHGIFVHDATTRVPLVLSWPGALPEGRAATGDARLVDVAPTVLELLGLPGLPGAQGASLVPQWGAQPERRPTYGEASLVSENLGMAPLLAWREGELRLVRTTRDRLFDLARDPTETRDFASERPDELMALSRGLEAFLSEHTVLREAEVAVDPATAEQLEALGYVGAGASEASGLDVYDHLDLARALTTVPLDPGQLDEGISRLEAALAEVPAASEGWLTLVLLASRQDEDRGAAYARQAEAHHPEHPFFQAVIAAAEAREGRSEAAAARLGRIAEDLDDPDSSKVSASGRTLALAGRVALGLGLDDEGLRFLDALEGQVGRYDDLVVRRALLRHAAARLPEAVADYEAWLAQTPDDPDAWRNLAYARAGAGDLHGARAALQRSLELVPDQPEARERLRLIEERLSAP